MRHRFAAYAAAAVCGLAASASAQVTAQNFQGGTTRDLATLCSASAPDPNWHVAQAFCHGFIIGAGQFHRSITAPGGPQRPHFCLPEQPPTIAQIGAAFATWSGANPQYGEERAVDGLMRYATATYPCPPAPTRARR